jgi:hypothetical protein
MTTVNAQSLYVPPDIAEAHERWGANCGPVALATILRRPVRDVRGLLTDFEHRRYMNVGMMRQALTRAGCTLRYTKAFPNYGVAFLQITGPWTGPGVPVPAAYRHTHWCAVVKQELDWRMIFDVNHCPWAPAEWWEEHVMKEIVRNQPRATGWYVRAGIEVIL